MIGSRFAEVRRDAARRLARRASSRGRSRRQPLPPEDRPARVALDQRRASHLRYRVTSADGVEREIEVTAFPLFAHTDEFVGVVVIFWRDVAACRCG